MKLKRVGAAGLAGSLAMALLALIVLPWVGGSNIAAACRSLLDEQARTEDLTFRDDAVKRSLEGKHQVTKALLDGELSLEEAAARFERLNGDLLQDLDESPGSTTWRGTTRADTYDSVIKWAATALHHRAGDREAALAQLERERARLERGAAAPVH